MACEYLLGPDVSQRGTRMLLAMREAEPSGISGLLMTWGAGHMGRRPRLDAHLRAGGTWIAWDLAYWNRDTHCRFTVNADHPVRLMDVPGDRWNGELRNDADPAGPVVIVGMGRKSRRQLGFAGLSWEQKALRRVRAAYPEREPVFRPKKPGESLDCRTVDGPIEDTLRGASLVVCRHSNVAVDACIAGIPVVCEGGAAATLYGNDLMAPADPSPDERRGFLQRLAYWQWQPSEASEAWKFLLTVCASM
jgi:hypothetical protein